MSRMLPILAALLLALAPAASAAPPNVPGQVHYQGVLLATADEPRTGDVDLGLRIRDALGNGPLVCKQVFLAIPLSRFTSRLAPAGSAPDSLASPATTSLADALAEDPGPTAPGRVAAVVGLVTSVAGRAPAILHRPVVRRG